MARARWFSPLALLLVVVGGAAGVAARAIAVVPLTGSTHPIVVPALTLGINLVGSLLLGIVVGGAGDRHPHARAFLGTGVLGGFTTYSAFAVHAVTVSTDSPFVGLALIAVSLFGGVLAAAVGLGIGGGRRAGAAGAVGSAGVADIDPGDAE